MTRVLDWSAARWAPGVCVDCGEPANLRDPATGASRHKTCAERVAVPACSTGSEPEAAALGPERAAKRSERVRYRPEGYPFDVARLRDVLAVWPAEPARIGRPATEPPERPPAVESRTVVAMRDLADGDPCPRGALTAQAALVAAGWAVRATYACVLVDGAGATPGGVLRHSVALRAARGGRRAWAVWVDGKATGGQVQGVRGTLGVTDWRRATGSAPTPKPSRGVPAPDPTLEGAPSVDLRPMDTPLP